ncbi:ABC transporter substrate-binding protein [Spirosoma fluviale]|uniref:Thiamine pyrimidine synthase n=1 Tax=Spirosoma fluviale TaxID=1597977 RepID=A0A286G0M5_9BACT|nr:ABC transporter substrate-binding protein [Spirosoma fluviale]SOD88992.1 NitT/TauT family transport system substrate-binding protein [Spirosoma fluviale]
MSTRIRLALDRTPNTNHTGFYVALAKGAYAQADLDVELIAPDQDDYQTMPARRVSQGNAELAITPSESVISYQTNGVPLIAVAAVLARDISAIVTLKESGISRPRELDGKVYGSYGARYEDDMIRQLIQNDDGRGQFISHKMGWSGIWRALLTREIDAAWCWLTWEGVQADIQGVDLNQFLFDEYEIPYGYNPVLTAQSEWTEQNGDALRRFLEATAAGYRFAIKNPDEAVRLMMKTANHPTLTKRNFLEQSQQLVSGYYLDGEGHWGFMHRNVWVSFTNWMIRNHLLTDKNGELIQRMDVETLFTNKFLEGVPAMMR